MSKMIRQDRKPPKPRRRTYKELVWEAVGAGLKASGEGALIANPEALGRGIDPEAAKAELIARLEKTIAKLAGRAVRNGSRHGVDDLKQMGIVALLKGLYHFKRHWDGAVPASFRTYIGQWIKWGMFERDPVWDKTVPLEVWHDKESAGPVHVCLAQSDELTPEGEADAEAPAADVESKASSGVFVCVPMNQKLCPDPLKSAELALLWKKVALLRRQERIVLTLRYKEGLSLEESGKTMGGITKERVRQIEAVALRKLRKMIGEGP